MKDKDKAGSLETNSSCIPLVLMHHVHLKKQQLLYRYIKDTFFLRNKSLILKSQCSFYIFYADT